MKLYLQKKACIMVKQHFDGYQIQSYVIWYHMTRPYKETLINVDTYPILHIMQLFMSIIINAISCRFEGFIIIDTNCSRRAKHAILMRLMFEFVYYSVLFCSKKLIGSNKINNKYFLFWSFSLISLAYCHLQRYEIIGH